MAPHRTAAAQGGQTWPAAPVPVARHPPGPFLRAADRLPMALLTPRLAADAGSNGTGKGKDGLEMTWGWTTTTGQPPSRRVRVLEAEEPAPRPAFPLWPRRGVVERTCAWLGQSRRLSQD